MIAAGLLAHGGLGLVELADDMYQSALTPGPSTVTLDWPVPQGDF